MNTIIDLRSDPVAPLVRAADGCPELNPAPSKHTPALVWWLRINFAAMVLSVVPTALRLAGSFRVNDTWHYSATEWLTNNSAGVTRRGLIGDVLLAVPVVDTRTALVTMALVLTVVGSVGFAALVGRAVRVSGSPWPLVFWLLPGGLIMGALQADLHGLEIGLTDFRLRREALFLAILLAVVLATLRWPSRRWWPAIAVPAAGVLAASVFVHEGFAAVTGAVVAYYLLWVHPNPPAKAISIPQFGRVQQHSVPTILVFLAPTVVCLGFVMALALNGSGDLKSIWFAVDPTTRDWVREQTMTLWGVDTQVPMAIWFLGEDAAAGLGWVHAAYFQSSLWMAWATTATVMAGWVALAAWLVDATRVSVIRALTILGILAVLMLPMFAVAIDWGRWLAFIVLVASVLILGNPAGVEGRQKSPLVRSLAVLVGCTLVVAAVAIELPALGGDIWLAQLFA